MIDSVIIIFIVILLFICVCSLCFFTECCMKICDEDVQIEESDITISNIYKDHKTKV